MEEGAGAMGGRGVFLEGGREGSMARNATQGPTGKRLAGGHSTWNQGLTDDTRETVSAGDDGESLFEGVKRKHQETGSFLTCVDDSFKGFHKLKKRKRWLEAKDKVGKEVVFLILAGGARGQQ